MWDLGWQLGKAIEMGKGIVELLMINRYLRWD